VSEGTRLVGEVVDLKRVRFAGVSAADRGFARAWAALESGEDVEVVAVREAALALAATQLGAMSEGVLVDAGLSREEAGGVLRAAVLAAGGAEEFAEAVTGDRTGRGRPPAFVARMAASPRAGVTAPGRPRYLLEPAESHAEHCWSVAVLAVLLASSPDARAEAFLCGLAHHLHNAWLPDAGFAGEVALGEHLDDVVSGLRARGLAQLDAPGLAEAAGRSVALATHADTPAAVAFNTADVLDRVLELRFHERAAAFTVREAVEDYEMVHAGPLQAFGQGVLRDWGLG
jgi:hypothetical protein